MAVMTLKPVQKKEGVVPATELSQTLSLFGNALESVSRMFCPKCEQKINT